MMTVSPATPPLANVPKAQLVPTPPITGHAPKAQWSTPPPMTINVNKRYTATLATSDGNIGVELLAKRAPIAVNNFVFLAKQGFYERVPIHRLIKNFMAQSGDPTGRGTGGPGYSFRDELPPAGTVYTKGTVAMANSGPNTNGSQFFVMLADTTLPPNYTIFGRVTSGANVLDRLNATRLVPSETGELSKPASPIGISSVTISEQ
ncbi:MAG: peptidyl-prolyl cis-trans isomerase (rotamase) - cyclophilin family [Thermoleophilia bacterium]|nr:peptidyl-prolyl cis-trans isomerase (rotamase) - cyclophilin family [Thermoleophilia bacterium]